ncbi:Transcription initiation factor TFIID subunit 2, partial, partial [Paramuricea clavata]
GPLTVCVQELDGSFKHTVQIEDSSSRHELQCHSKSRRNKRKKIPLITGEEVDIDLDTMDSDSPVLWIRIDPEVNLIRQVLFKQSDFMWHFQLRHERDVIAQAEAIENLMNFPTRQTMMAFIDIAKQKECFYKVRLNAVERLGKLQNETGEQWNIHLSLIAIFQDIFGSQTCSTIVRYNDFSNFIDYFVQKAIVSSIGFCRDIQSQCPKAVVQFLLDLLKYNDNRLNQ